VKVSEIMEVDPITVRDDAVVNEAVRLLDENRIRHLPVLRGDALVGVLSDRDLLETAGRLVPRLDEEGELEPLLVRDVMGARPVTVIPEDTVGKAAEILTEWGIGCLPVVRRDVLVGFLTETDLLELFVGASRYGAMAGVRNPRVAECMTADPCTARADTTIGEALERMNAGDFRHLPLTDDDGLLLGLVSDRDLRRAAGRGLGSGTRVGKLVAGHTSTAGTDEPLSRVAYRMAHERIGALPVVDGRGKLLGIVTAMDVVAHCARVFDD